jgi:photosystem II stability/assembly factor-like uncharacterized protein
MNGAVNQHQISGAMSDFDTMQRGHMKTGQSCCTIAALTLSVLLCVEPLIAQKVSWDPTKGPYGGAVTSLLADRQGNLFAGTQKGVFRSTNNGDTWALSASFTPYPGAFLMDSSGAILAGCTGLWRSTDAGVTWNLAGKSGQYVKFLTVAPSGDVYAGIDGPQTRGVFPLSNPYWIRQGSDTSFNLRGVSFINTNTGTVVGDSGTILHTTDGGVTWTRQTSGTTEGLADVCFKNANMGIAVGSMGTILRTTDGGAYWTVQSSGTSEGLRGLSFADTLHGTAVGESGTILRTTDGGVTWTSQTSGTTNWLFAVSFSDSNTGTAVGQGGFLHGIILRTTDGGATWIDQTWSSTPPLYGVCFINADTGTAVGSDAILRTTDGGATWTMQTSPFRGTLKDVSFTDANTGAAVGLAGTALRTTDGGMHWVLQSALTNDELEGVSLVDANTCVAVGSRTILRSRSGSAALVPEGLIGHIVKGLLFSKRHGLLALVEEWSSVYRGSTSDTSWELIGSASHGGFHGFAEDTAGNLFAGPEWAGVYRSTDGGVSWDSTGLISGQSVYALAPLANGKIYAGAVPLDPSVDGGIYVSSDGGLTWDSLGLKDWGVYSVLALKNSQLFLGTDRGVFRSSNGGNDWEVASVGLVAGNALSLLAVDSSTVLVGTDFGLFRSPDNGTSWQESSNGILPHFIRSLAADSSGNLFAGNMVFGPQGGIFKSTDAGRTWRCTSGDSIKTCYTPIQAIVVTQMNTILAGVGSMKWWIARSTDSGETWMPVPRITNFYSPQALALDRAGNIYGACWGTGVFRSTDDGLTWSYVNADLSTLNIYCLAARDSGEAYAGGLGGVFQSTNAGSSWKVISTSLGRIDVRAIAFDIGGDLVVSTYTGDVYRTTDEGNTWTKDPFPGSNQLIHSLSSRGGDLFAADSSGVYRCTRATTSVGIADALVPESARLEQNYPNPFNTTTVIRCQVPVASMVRLVVYDVLGREVAVLMNEKREPGRYEVHWDATGLSSGVYICRMNAGSYMESRKMLMLR